jgi:hypothetical protein
MEECIASIFMAEESSRESLLPPGNTGSSLADFSVLKMEAIRSSGKSVHTRFTQRHIPEDGVLQLCLCLWDVKYQEYQK